MKQPTLFDLAAPAPRARRSDPASSRQAADSMRDSAAEHRSQILAALHDTDAPLSAEQIAARVALTHVQVNRRMAELRRMGLVEITGALARTATGRHAQTYRAKTT